MPVTGLILAGGRGTRMGGMEKALQPLRGKPLIAHAIARLRPQVDRLAINANRAFEAYRAFGMPLWPDLRDDLAGPMAGIEAGLAACETELLATVPCDAPCFPDDLVARLHQAMRAGGAGLAYAVTKHGQKCQPQPVFCLLRRDALPLLRAALERGEHGLGAWLRAQGAAQAVYDDEAAFANINTPAELQEYEP